MSTLSYPFIFLLLTLANPSHASPDPLLRQTTKSGGGGGGAVQPLWCVAKNNADDNALQQGLDWACGAGGADCAPIQQGGPCYDLTDVLGMASYAFNNYCLKNGMTEDACNFSNTAALTSLDPSHDKCKFPSSSTNVVSSSGASTTTGMDTGAIADTSSSAPLANAPLFTSSVLALFFLLLFIHTPVNPR